MERRSSRGAKLAEAKEILAQGGVLRFIWASSSPAFLVKASGELRILDGRAYDALVNHADLVRTENGSTETKDLVIEWRQR
jgi:hypothetical protein